MSKMRTPRRRGTAGASRGLALIAAAVTVLVTVGERLAMATSASWQAVRAPGPARLEDAVGVLAGGAALAVVAWLVVAVVASVVSALAPPSLPLVRHLTGAVAPRLIRHGVAAMVGAIVVGGAATSAHAAGDPGLTSRAAATAVLSGHAAQTAAQTRPMPVDAGWRSTRTDVSPGWLPTEPPASRPAAADPRDSVQARLRPGAAVDDEVVVRRGDSLWSIAERHLGPGATSAEIAHEWPRWYAANRGRLGGDPDQLSPGQRLRPPQVVTTSASRTAGSGAGLGGGR